MNCCQRKQIVKVPVRVKIPCKLPPKPVLPEVESSACKDPSVTVCYDTMNAAKLLLYLKRLKLWYEEALAACGKSE
jgi:hypothetical protein